MYNTYKLNEKKYKEDYYRRNIISQMYRKRYFYPLKNNNFKAAGILLYDDNYIYTILEKVKNKFVLNDMGGKFTMEDFDIYQTAAREFCEETYFTIPLTYFTLKTLEKNDELTKIYTGFNKKKQSCQYLTFLIEIDKLEKVENFKFDKLIIKEEIEQKYKEMQNLLKINCISEYNTPTSFCWLDRYNFIVKNCSDRLVEILMSSNLIKIFK